ncbi:MAG TPA: hypothetical protein VH108_13230 [Gaiellaceae bacterium]|nr:hypothetical protein [Gaiellaceae bacterium]
MGLATAVAQSELVATLHVSDPELRDELIADLRSRPDLIVAPGGGNSIEVNVLGSYNTDAMRLVIDLRVRAWEAAQLAAGRTIHVDLD